MLLGARMFAMPEMEKMTVNLGPVDLGQIELLVEQGFYANRAEFIRSAIQSQLQRHSDAVNSAAVRQAFVIGAMTFDRRALEKSSARGERLKLNVIGYLGLDPDITPALAAEAIESVKVRGIFRATAAVKQALADRTE
jgi:Arc/MetJ-type ribon-helix-helix transcriptional regulator